MSLAYSLFESGKNEKTDTSFCEKRTNKRKTYKKRRKESPKVTNFLNSLPTKEGFQEISQSDANLSGDENPQMAATSHEEFSIGEDYQSEGLLREGLEQTKNYHANQENQQQYYNQYVPSYTGTTQNIPYYSQLLDSSNLQSGSQDELMKKLNYVVHMLEEQHDEKTGSVTEELVLYMFLGVFVIFVVDSFSRSGKYKR